MLALPSIPWMEIQPVSIFLEACRRSTVVEISQIFSIGLLSLLPGNNMEIAPSPNGTLNPQFLVIDYFIVQTNPSTKSGGATTRVSAIVGGVIGGVVGLAALLLALYFFCIRRRHFQHYSNSGTVPDFGAVTQYPSLSTFSPDALYTTKRAQSSGVQRGVDRRGEAIPQTDSGVRLPPLDEVPPIYTEY